MATTTWDALFKGRTELIRKGLFGSVMIQDYTPAAALAFAAWTPFDPDTGLLNDLSTSLWQDLGYLDDTGISFAKKTAYSDSTVWQSRDKVRSDATQDADTATFTLMETRPTVEAIYHSLPLLGMPDIGATNYVYTKAKIPALLFRSILFIGVDGSGDSVEYTVKLWPRALMTAPNKYDWTAKSEAFWPVAFEPYPDANAGFAARTWRDGPGHRSHGPVTVSATPTVGAVTATTAVVNWASAAGGTAPYTYQVYTGGVLSNINNVSGTSGTVSGLTTNTVYNFTVRAKDSAFHQSGASTAVSGKTA